jgi:F-type H+-transporting ATPase subunit gamma
MPSTRDIRRRIKSVRNTAQITKAMQMVAASKMRKAQQSALAGRPYATLMSKVLAEVTTHESDVVHPLSEIREVRKRAIILVGTDKGLCGALNGNLMREVVKLDQGTTAFITAGRKAAQFIARTRRTLIAEFTYKDAPQFSEARAISKFAQDLFLKGEADRVDIVFTQYVSTLTQKPLLMPFLPVGEMDELHAHLKGAAPVGGEAEKPASEGEFLFEPSAQVVLGALLPHALNYRIYQVLLEAKASEHSARMVAMKNATDNAHQIIKDLTLEYNKLRQSNITRELLEITSAAMGMG